MALRDQLWPLLKWGPISISDLAHELDVPYSVLWRALLEIKQYLNFEDDKITLKINFDPLPKAKATAWPFKAPPLEGLAPLPEEYDNPLVVELAPGNQGGGRGICAGANPRFGADLNHMQVTGERPTDEDRAAYRENVQEPNGVIHNTGFKITASSEGLYEDGREEGHVTAPMGSYTIATLKSWVKRGHCFEKQWATSLDSRCVNVQPPQGNLQDIAATRVLHRLHGFAELPPDERQIELMKRAIMERGWVAISEAVYENFYLMEGGDGWYPRALSDLQKVGAHSEVFTGWNKRGFKKPISWVGFTGIPTGPKVPKVLIGGTPYEYWLAARLDCFVPLGADEAKRYAEENLKVLLSCNLHANLYINRQFIGTVLPGEVLPAWVGRNVPFEVFAEAIEFYNLNKAENYVLDKEGPLPITLTPPEPPQPEPLKKSLLELILDWIRRRFG
jgi:hypothetical protein